MQGRGGKLKKSISSHWGQRGAKLNVNFHTAAGYLLADVKPERSVNIKHCYDNRGSGHLKTICTCWVCCGALIRWNEAIKRKQNNAEAEKLPHRARLPISNFLFESTLKTQSQIQNDDTYRLRKLAYGKTKCPCLSLLHWTFANNWVNERYWTVNRCQLKTNVTVK